MYFSGGSKQKQAEVTITFCLVVYFSLDCPSGFRYGGSGFSKCYAVISDRLNWNTAQQKCEQMHNGQLAVFMNSREEQIAYQILRNHGINAYFYTFKLQNVHRMLFSVNRAGE